jgi:hypothetical protein
MFLLGAKARRGVTRSGERATLSFIHSSSGFGGSGSRPNAPSTFRLAGMDRSG